MLLKRMVALSAVFCALMLVQGTARAGVATGVDVAIEILHLDLKDDGTNNSPHKTPYDVTVTTQVNRDGEDMGMVVKNVTLKFPKKSKKSKTKLADWGGGDFGGTWSLNKKKVGKIWPNGTYTFQIVAKVKGKKEKFKVSVDLKGTFPGLPKITIKQDDKGRIARKPLAKWAAGSDNERFEVACFDFGTQAQKKVNPVGYGRIFYMMLAKGENLNKKTGLYEVKIKDQEGGTATNPNNGAPNLLANHNYGIGVLAFSNSAGSHRRAVRATDKLERVRTQK